MSRSVTGPRPASLFGYVDAYSWQLLKHEIVDVLEELNVPRVRDIRAIITCGAQGVDQTAFKASAEFARRHDVRNVIYVPYSGQDVRWHRDGLFGKNIYKGCLADADEVMNVSPSVKAGFNGTSRYDILNALTRRNHQMVDDSDIVIAVNPLCSSGTTATARYAVKHDKPIYVIEANEPVERHLATFSHGWMSDNERTSLL